MNIKDYKERKSNGLAEIVIAGGGHALVSKRFSIYDGTEIEPETISIDTKELSKRKAALLLELTDYNTIFADMEKLKK